MQADVRNLIDDPRFRAYHAQLAAPKFNAFDVLRYSDYEIRHSNVVAWLLQPAETHGIGSRFLEWFVGQVNGRLPADDRVRLSDASFGATNVDVWRERDYVDVMIRFKNEKRLVVVENKLGPAGSESLEQVMAYCRRQREKHEDHAVTGVLLSTSPDGGVRIDDLMHKVPEKCRHRPVAHVGWESVLGAVGSLHAASEFPEPSVQAFVGQYIDMVDGWLRPAEGFADLLDDYRDILKKLRDVLEADGGEVIRSMAPAGLAEYAGSLIKLVQASRHDPKKLRAAVADYLRARAVGPSSSGNAGGLNPGLSNNRLRTVYWLWWTDAPLAGAVQAMGGHHGALSWTLTFSHLKVEMHFGFQSDNAVQRSFIDQIKRFMDQVPINRRELDRYAIEDGGGGWEKVYPHEILSEEQLAEMSAPEAEREVIQRLGDFIDSADSEYTRIDDYFQCLAHRFDE